MTLNCIRCWNTISCGLGSVEYFFCFYYSQFPLTLSDSTCLVPILGQIDQCLRYEVHVISFQPFFRMGIQNCRWLLKVQYVIALHLMRWLANSYDFRFKGTAAIGIHPTKAWLSLLVNFKNAIWHFRRTTWNKILFSIWKKCQRNVWNASDCFSIILHEWSISFWVA